MKLKFVSGGVTAPMGFTASGVHCGIRKNKTKRDLALIYCDTPCAAAAVYTQNLVKGAPLRVTKRHLENGVAQAVVCNSGIANTCSADGEEKAGKMAEVTAAALGILPEDVIVASTGVIGPSLPMEPIAASAGELADSLSKDGSGLAAEAIMTTDTRKKELAVSCALDGHEFRIGLIAKGSGMIHPNMATMLCFVTTDAAISREMLQNALTEAVDVSFNMVSIDGDTSTNDMVAVLASGQAGNPKITEKGEDYAVFAQTLRVLCVEAARRIAADGEGATKLLVCSVAGASDEPAAKALAKSVICSSLVKAAMFGADANWGRILCAIGYSGVKCDVTKVDVRFASQEGSILVCKDGAGVDFDEDEAKKILLASEVHIEVTLHEGEGRAEAFGCDLTYDYVKINGDYRT